MYKWSDGTWRVGQGADTDYGWVKSVGTDTCPEDIRQWQFFDRETQWKYVTGDITVRCDGESAESRFQPEPPGPTPRIPPGPTGMYQPAGPTTGMYNPAGPTARPTPRIPPGSTTGMYNQAGPTAGAGPAPRIQPGPTPRIPTGPNGPRFPPASEGSWPRITTGLPGPTP